MEHFFSCTQLPIAAVTQDSKHACSRCEIPNLNRFPENVLERQRAGEIKVTIDNERAAYYLLPICPCNKRPGTFLLGPYITEQNPNSIFTYRPKEVWPSLVALLRNLQGIKSHTICHEQDRPHCLPVHRAKRIIHQYYDQGITLEETAKRLGLNKSYLSSLFREETGQTFTEYVNEVRINASIQLLQQSSESILDIALQVGFSNQNYYSRIFKKLTGISPSEFRQQTLANLD